MIPEDQTLIVGADAASDLVISHPSVSGTHLRLRREGALFVLEDLQSTNGTFVQGQRIQQAQVQPETPIGLGAFGTTVKQLLETRAPARPAAPSRPATPSAAPAARHSSATPGASPSGRPNSHFPEPDEATIRTLTVGSEVINLGRLDDCEICIKEASVSARHARVFRNAGRLVLEDLGSVNGTLVRGEGREEWVSFRNKVLRTGDLVRVGSQCFRFERPTVDTRVRASGARLDVQELVVQVTHNETGQPLRLLNEVSFTTLPGELVGIMGPSGSGKTTLLDVLAGYLSPTAGEVLVNAGSIFGSNGKLLAGFGQLIGQGPQHDVVHPMLTVREATLFSAKLRTPASLSNEELERRVDQAIENVALTPKAGTQIAPTGRKTLSGGQRKRVNIAMELVNAPRVLLLDEPSSGLSSHDTAELMQLLRRLADQGNTVILTIHQPSYASYVQMDQVLILEEGGHTAYFGPTGLDSFDHYDVVDREPEALLERMDRKTDPAAPGRWARKFAASELKERFVDLRRQSLASNPGAPLSAEHARGAFSHTKTLVQRNLRLKARDPFFLSLSLLVPILVTMLFAQMLNAGVPDTTVWSPKSAETEHSFLVVLAIMVSFFGALSSSLEIIRERDVLKRERRGGLGLLPYVLSKAIVYVIPSLLFPICSLGVLYAMSSDILQPDLLELWRVLVPAFFASACAGLLISATIRTEQLVIVIAVFYAIVQVVFSVFVPLHITYDQPNSDGQGSEDIEKGERKWQQLAAMPITARWTLAGLAAQSDLCENDELERQPPAPKWQQQSDFKADKDYFTSATFLRTCQKTFYQDHGVEQVGSRSDRMDSEITQQSILANLLLAALSLLATGLALRTRDD